MKKANFVWMSAKTKCQGSEFTGADSRNRYACACVSVCVCANPFYWLIVLYMTPLDVLAFKVTY